MSDVLIETERVGSSWDALAERVLGGQRLTRDEGQAILQSDDLELPALLAAAFRVRLRHFGRKVHLYYLKNAKSGLCPEDCGYCSQSIVADTEINRYPLLNEAKLMDGARQASAMQARTYCIVASGRGPSDREVDHVASVVSKIKAELRAACLLLPGAVVAGAGGAAQGGRRRPDQSQSQHEPPLLQRYLLDAFVRRSAGDAARSSATREWSCAAG